MLGAEFELAKIAVLSNMLVRTKLEEMCLPLAWSVAFKLDFSQFVWLGYSLEYLVLQTDSNLGFFFCEIRGILYLFLACWM